MDKFLEKFSALTLVLYPVFACYNVGSIALYKYLMMSSCILLFLGSKGRERFFLPKYLLRFYIYAFSIPVAIAIILGAMTNFLGAFLTPLLFVLNLILILPHLKVEIIYRYYKIIVFLACGVFVLQEISYYTMGYRFGALIPFLDLYFGSSASEYMKNVMIYQTRSSSFFVEPSHFAQYLAPFFAIELKKLNEKGKIFNFTSVFITLVFVFLRSGNGLFLCAVIWIFAFLFSRMRIIKKLFLVLPLILCTLYFGYGFFSTSEEGEEVLERIEQLNVEQDRVSSGLIRIYRGFFVFEEMPIEAKIFGVGAGGVDYMIDNSRYHWMFLSEKDHYLNNASFFLMAYGYIGTFFFILFLIDILMKNSFLSIIIVAAFITLSLMESFVFETRMLLYISLASLPLLSKIRQEKTILNRDNKWHKLLN